MGRRRRRKKDGDILQIIPGMIMLGAIAYLFLGAAAIVAVALIVIAIAAIARAVKRRQCERAWAETYATYAPQLQRSLPPLPQPAISTRTPIADLSAPLVSTTGSKCSRCRAWLPDTARFCRRCGIAQPAPAFAPTEVI
jgi:hypothetical protein